MSWIARFSLLWLGLLAWGAAAVAQTGVVLDRMPVEKIEIRNLGPPAASDDLIRANISSAVGQPYIATMIDRDIQALLATGFFRDVRVSADRTTSGVKLIYVLQGKPVLQEIKFEGNKKYSVKKLMKKVPIRAGQPLDDFKIHTGAMEIQKLYQKAGYQQSKVEPKVVVTESTGRATATYVITEGVRIRVIDVVFDGAQAFSQRKLRAVIKTRRWWMFSWLTGSGKLKDEQFDEDKQKLFEFYQDAGYIDFEIRAVKFDYTAPNRLIIRFTIFEGKQYRVGNVSFKGNEKFSQDSIQRGVAVMGVWVRPRMLAGSVFTPKGLEKDIEAIQDFYGAFGYIGRGSSDRIGVGAQKVPNIDLGTMDLVFNLEEGEKSRIERIDVAGNTRTKDRVIRRELAVLPGEDFNMVKVRLSTERLRGLGFLANAQSEVEPTDIRDRKNLVISVEEGQSGQFFMGAGFSTVEKLFGYVGMTQGNFDLFNPPYFTGGGQKIKLQATVGTELQNYELKFVEPWFLGRKLALEVDLFYQDIGYYSTIYDQSQIGARVGLYRPLFIEALRAGVSYTIENIDISFKQGTTTTNVFINEGPGRGRNSTIIPPTISPQMAKEQGSYRISMPAFTLAYDTRGGGLLPNRGQRTEATFSVAMPYGGDTTFYKLELESAWYFEGFAPGHVLELIGKVGVGVPFGDTPQIPIFDRFFLGGAYSLRGYEFRAVGPVDIYDQPLGGQTMWFGSAEYSIPIMERLRVAAFYDVGMVYAEPWGFDSNLWCDDVGIGLRINIPQMGPLRLDYAWPIHHVPWVSGKPHFQFSVGYTRGY